METFINELREHALANQAKITLIQLTEWANKAEIMLKMAARELETGRGKGSGDEMSGWQPIETAPKDERDILVWERTLGRHMVVSFECGSWVMSCGEYVEFCNDSGLTNWMPLPEPPE